MRSWAVEMVSISGRAKEHLEDADSNSAQSTNQEESKMEFYPTQPSEEDEALLPAKWICYIPVERHLEEDTYHQDMNALFKLLPVPMLTMSNWDTGGFTKLYLITVHEEFADELDMHVFANFLAGFWRITPPDVHYMWGDELDAQNYQKHLYRVKQYMLNKRGLK